MDSLPDFLDIKRETVCKLRSLLNSPGHAGNIVRQQLAIAEQAIQEPITFPPRGGQHNQWYQCTACQYPLEHTPDGHLCRHCQQLYHGAPYDDVIFGRIHAANLRRAHEAALGYLLTDEEQFAAYTSSILLGYARRYEGYELHDNDCKTGEQAAVNAGKLQEQTLNEASLMIRFIAPAYDLTRHADQYTSSDLEFIDNQLLRPMINTIMRHSGVGSSNWQSYHNAAILYVGALLNDKTMIEQAIYDPINGFNFQMDVSVSDEGFWHENSWGYHFYTLDALTVTAKIATRCGIDLWQNQTFEKMYTIAADYQMPDGSLPCFGDDSKSLANSNEALEIAYAAYQAPGILTLLPKELNWYSLYNGRFDSNTGQHSQKSSLVLAGAGHAILRGTAPAAINAVFPFGKWGGFHSHYDKLSFVLFAFGREYGVDRGRAKSQAYRLPIHSNWYRATCSHNTVTVDGKSQNAADGELLAFDDSNEPYTIISCRNVYDGVDHIRWAVAMPEYLLVVDELRSQKSHDYHWWYHNLGNATTAHCHLQPVTPGSVPDFQGMEYCDNLKSGITDAPLKIEFHGNSPLSLFMAADENQQLLLGDGAGVTIEERIPFARFAKSAKNTCFAAALLPKNGDSDFIQAINYENVETGINIKVSHSLGCDDFLLAQKNIIKEITERS